MLPETREALFIFRDWLHAYAQGKVSARQLARGPRTDFLELLRRDLGHSSLWRRNYAELLKQNRDRINQILEIKADLQEQED